MFCASGGESRVFEIFQRDKLASAAFQSHDLEKYISYGIKLEHSASNKAGCRNKLLLEDNLIFVWLLKYGLIFQVCSTLYETVFHLRQLWGPGYLPMSPRIQNQCNASIAEPAWLRYELETGLRAVYLSQEDGSATF